MKTSTIIGYFGGVSKAARALRIKPQTLYDWQENKVPWHRQIQAEGLSNGVLSHDPKSVPEHIRGFLKMPKRKERTS